MKKILIFILSTSLLTSCTELEVTPTAFITKENFFKTEDDATASITAVYASLSYDATDQSLYGRNLYFLTDMGSDYAAAGASAINPNVRAISGLTYDATTDRVQVAWGQIYNGINRANISIDNIPKVEGNEIVKTRLINEAKFIRALLYFQAVRLWGGVPLVLHEPTSIEFGALKVSRSTVDEVYDQIIKDLTDAENLPATYSASQAGRATSGAAKALLVKVYLTRKDWPKTIAKAQEVIASAKYDLFPHFEEIFNVAKKNGIEHIFSVQFEPNQGGNGTSGSTFMRTAFAGFTAVEPADIISNVALFYDIYLPGDTRRDVSYAKQLLNPATGTLYTFPKPIFKKYIQLSILASGGSNVAINFPFIRYADVLLAYAEAINEQGGPTPQAYDAVNQVIRRAYDKPSHTPDPTVDVSGLNQTSFRELIYEERKKEFVQEGQRWFDLVRWGRLVSEVKKVVAKAAVSERNNLYPIPQSQVSLNPEGLPQNPGY